MSTEFWIGTIVSIPIGIGTAILTPWLVNTFANWSKTKRQKNIEKAQKEYEQISEYYKNKTDLSLYYLNVVIRTTFVGAFMAIFSGIFIVCGQMISSLQIFDRHLIVNIMFGTAQFMNLFGSLLIVGFCRPAINIWRKIKNFQEYEERLKRQQII